MKTIERIAIVVCVATVLRYASFLFAGHILESLQEHYEINEHTAMFWMREIPNMVMWLLVNVMVAGWVFVDAPRHGLSRPVWVALALASGVFGFALYLLRVLLAKYESGQRPVRTCRKCGCDLTGNITGVCPECGDGIDLVSTPDRV